MRRTCALGIYAAILLLVPTTNAYAWWEFVESLSGPGRWTGPDVDARLMCFVDTRSRPENKAALTLLDTARDATPSEEEVRKAQNDPDARLAILAKWRTALPSWQIALDRWEQLAGANAFKVSTSTQSALDGRARAEQTFRTNQDDLRSYEKTRNSLTLAQRNEFDQKTLSPVFADTERAIRAYEIAVSGLRGQARVGMAVPLVAPGFILSACRLSENERRRAAIDVSMRFLWTTDDRFVPDGEKIYLSTVEPAFSWSLFDDPNHDFVDYGIGAGFYWIASERFPTVSGGFLEPVRLDWHAPSRAPRALRMFIVRTGLLIFPGGFAPEAFPLLSGVPNTRISRDPVKYIGFYLDTDYLFKPKRR
jgi:hypothetical protein